MSEKSGLFRLRSIKGCPVCGGELEKGYMHAAKGIYWDIVRDKSFMLPGCEGILSMWSWTLPYVPALKCNKCKIVIAPYGRHAKGEWAPGEIVKPPVKLCYFCRNIIPATSEECRYCGRKQKEQGE